MNRVSNQVVSAMVAACICALGIAIYDATVRKPRTPRLALIDIARIYQAADQGFKARALEDAVGATTATGAARQGTPLLRQPGDFGPALNDVLQALAGECRCAIVAMATVVGSDSTIPDFTDEAAQRLGLTLREGPRP